MNSMKAIVIVGSINTDLVMRASRHVLPGETLHADSFEVFTGGKGANQAVAAARLDAKAVMVGNVGSDAFGRERIDALQAAGVQTECIRVVDGSSGMAVIVVSATGENSILILSGANGEMSPVDVERHRALILNAGMVLTQLETPLPMLEALAMLCSEHGVPLMLDPAPARPLSLELLRHITWLTPNESEAEQLFHRKLDGVDEKCLAKLADEVLADGPQNLLLKLGSRGAYLATRDGQRMLLPAIAVPVVDTTAAGDAFNGAFATRLVAGDEPLEAARFAIAAAALSVTRHGALPSMPDAPEVQALLHLQPHLKMLNPADKISLTEAVHVMTSRRNSPLAAFLLAALCIATTSARGQEQAARHASVPTQKVIFDTDIGDDIDDVFALGLVLNSPELNVLGVTSAWGDTELRARLLQRFLQETGHGNIPVSMGRRTTPAPNAPFTQAAWAQRMPPPGSPLPNAVDFILDQIRKYPGEITLISVAPLTNIGDLLDRDPVTFHKLKRVIIMGGSVRKGYGDLGYKPDHGPDPEYNIRLDIPAARKLFTSGIPLTVLPLDSTQLKLDEVKRAALFSADTPLTNATTTLYEQWTYSTNNPTPTLFDVLAVEQALEPATCPTEPMLLTVDDQGYTREGRAAGQNHPNVLVCLHPNAERVFNLLMDRLIVSK